MDQSEKAVPMLILYRSMRLGAKSEEIFLLALLMLAAETPSI